jgi:hypothetical protein
MFCLKSKIFSPFGELYNTGFKLSFSTIDAPKSGIKLYVSLEMTTSSSAPSALV